MRSLFAFVITILNVAACFSLQIISPPADRSYDLFGSPRTNTDSSQQQHVTVIIQSRPYNGSRSGNTAIPEFGKLRRNIVIEKEEASEENYTEPKQIHQYAIDCGDDKACLEAHGLDYPEPTFKPYTQEELERLLAQYTASHGNPPDIEQHNPSNKLANLYMDDEEAVINVLETNPKKDQETSKSASWQLLNSQKHNHPYDDKKGWVTLEPVPWAQSQIQKWEPNAKPQIPSWDPSSHNRPSSSHWDAPRPSHDYSTERPWQKPSYEYKPSWSQWTRPQEKPQSAHPAYHPHTSHPPPHDIGWGPNPDIITDNRPGYFPGPPPSHRPWYDQDPYSSNKPAQVYEERPAYHGRPSSHPEEGDGQWVLLSSTKGYSTAHRDRGQYQRAFSFGTKTPAAAASVSSHRAVRLTVLPADNSTNTTLSHGGLLEVENSLQTVEEAQREHAAKMLKLTLDPDAVKHKREEVKVKPEDFKEKQKASSVRANSRRSTEDIKVFSATPTNAQSKTAVLAAIGAGLVPASMAMVLPMVLGRRRRSTDNEDELSVNATKLETVIHLQKYKRHLSFTRNE